MAIDSVRDFYDRLADDYELVYGGRWEDAVDRQGAALDGLIAELAPGARTVLDCSCGIGTQAIGLARRGYVVTATDLSARSVARARTEAARLGVQLRAAVADFRDLAAVGGVHDVVLSADNALPHLGSDAEVVIALRSMSARLRPDGGLLLVSTRDYDAGLVSRPPSAPPIVVDGPPRQVVVRLHDWDGPASRWYTVRFLLLCESDDRDGWTVRERSARYRAITAGELAAAARRAGLDDVRWHDAAAVGFHQPVMSARRRLTCNPSATPSR